MTNPEIIAVLLQLAWLAPLAGFVIEVFGGYWSHLCPGGRFRSRGAAYIAVGCIGGGFLLSLAALVLGIQEWDLLSEPKHGQTHHHAGEIYLLAQFGDLRIAIDYYIDSLTLVMFTMVTLIATCIHVFAIGYMDDERTEDHADHEVHLADKSHLHRPGRFFLFFSYMSLFCFSMLGLVLAGNIFMVFVFWELVGICSYLLIGFYVERHSASTAANKAFIVNRVGDFGFIIGLMIFWTYCGTFTFVGYEAPDGHTGPGLFEQVRHHGEVTVLGAGTLPGQEYPEVQLHNLHENSHSTIPYWLLVAAGLGIFAGCVGKSAQFPLQTWLPDAMEGPTPVSALVHSATMVAAGVYLAGRFFPVFLPEVLLTIAYVGAITLFVAATIALVATDIKRVLAYSTISQLGYMMLAIGLGGWAAGLFHLVTHAFFKSLMFLCAGSVIVGCHHVQEMTRMGGLWKKMPITGWTMLAGVVAITGLAIPFHLIFDLHDAGFDLAFSGYHSKDAIIATALNYSKLNPYHLLLFLLPLVTAGITAFYMFRLWFRTFTGEPRDKELFENCHESPRVMTWPLMILAFFAIFVAIGGERGPLFWIMGHSETHVVDVAGSAIRLATHDTMTHSTHVQAGWMALLAAGIGLLLAWRMYCKGSPDPAGIRQQFAATHEFLVEKWRFDELYDAMFVRPVHVVASWLAAFDRRVLDGFLHRVVSTGVATSRWDRWFDETFIDGAVDWTAQKIYAVGRSLQVVQTGLLRQYVMFIAVGVVTLFVLMFALFPK